MAPVEHLFQARGQQAVGGAGPGTRPAAPGVGDRSGRRTGQFVRRRARAAIGSGSRSVGLDTARLASSRRPPRRTASEHRRSAPSGRAIRLQAEPIRLATDKAVSLGGGVTELVTNAYKYAYPAEIQGEIRVRVMREGPDTLSLAVEDDGVGWSGEGQAQGTGLGSRIIRAMASNLRSVLTYVPGRIGTRAVLSFQT
ncbi:MAG: sensor histidine kinase [Methylorubrum populi]